MSRTLRSRCCIPVWVAILLLLSPSHSSPVLISSRKLLSREWLRNQYLEIIKLSLTGTLLQTDSLEPHTGTVDQLPRRPYHHQAREHGEDWPDLAYTMVGHKRLDNIRALLETCLQNGTPGDFVECGVWRGGASIFAKAVLNAWGASQRDVILVDSFQGLPKATHHLDTDMYSQMDYLKVPQEVVAGNFKRYQLLDNRVRFFKGFFNASAPILSSWLEKHQRSIAVLRLDGDMYVSLMDCLTNLYPHVSTNGFVIIDDWQITEARQAVNDFRAANNITSEILRIDNLAVYWRKTLEP